MDEPDLVRFVENDRFGLWRQDDLAEDLGWETNQLDAPPIRVLRMLKTGEVLTLSDPFGRGLVEPI